MSYRQPVTNEPQLQNGEEEYNDEIEDCEDCGPRPTTQTLCPLIEIANPRFGQPTGEQDGQGRPRVDQEPTMLVYRPWSAHDRRRATKRHTTPQSRP